MTTLPRLRQTFKYPTDPSSRSSTPEDLDEQEQEELITTLQSTDQATNAIYIKAFTILPLATIPAFIVFGVSKNASGGVRLLCGLAVTSLIATAFEMWFVPYTDSTSRSTGPSSYELSNRGRGRNDDDGGVRRHMARSKVRRIPWIDVEIDDDGPLGRVLPWLNVGICTLLVLAGLGLRGRKDIPEGLWAFLFLPALILGIVVVVKRSMRDVEVGIGELDQLKYGYKGA